jgi:beta-glucanase (GH16 family)
MGELKRRISTSLYWLDGFLVAPRYFACELSRRDYLMATTGKKRRGFVRLLLVATSCLVLTSISSFFGFETNSSSASTAVTGSGHPLIVVSSKDVGKGDPSYDSEKSAPRDDDSVTTIFDDEFSGKTLSSPWVVDRGANPSNGELECYARQNVSVSGGYLHEQVVNGRWCGAYCPPTSMTLCPYVSGDVQWATFNFTYGTITVRAKFAGGIGPWPAVWLLGADCQSPTWLTSSCNWPTSGSSEIDIAEVLGSNDNRVNEQIHAEDAYGDVEMPKCEPYVSESNKKWYNYTLIWTPESLTWEIDGVQTCQMTQFVPNQPMFLIINTAVGGIGAGRVAPKTLPQTTEIDYVRVTQPAS